MQKIVPFLWFDTQAEEAARFYTSLFKDAEVLRVTPGPDGKAMSVSFQLEGQEYNEPLLDWQLRLAGCVRYSGG